MKLFFSGRKVLALSLTGLGLASLLVAQPSVANPNQTLGTEGNDSANSLYNSAGEFNPLNLIHQAQFGNVQLNYEEQTQQLNDVAAKFRAKQQQLMGNEQQKPELQAPSVEVKPSKKNTSLNEDK